MKSKPSTPCPTAAQVEAIEALRAAAASVDALTVVDEPTLEGADLSVKLSFDMSVFAPGPGGLKVGPVEEFTLTLPEGFPWALPRARVAHHRWLGEPHVLNGNRLCLFLDPQREWSPVAGGEGELARLWTWIDDAVAGRHNSATALHHGFGGVTSVPTSGAVTLVVGAELGGLRPGIRRITVEERSSHRLEVVAGDGSQGRKIPALLVVSLQQLPAGLPRTLEGIVAALHSPWRSGTGLRRESAGFPKRDMTVGRIERLVRDTVPSEPVVVVVAAPNRAVAGNGSYDLMAVRLTAGAARAAVANLKNPDAEVGPVLEFLNVDDVRPDISMRRDDGRPTSWYVGKRVEVWGCGALGSWVAELLVRAGVRRLVVRDVASVSSGLLVRQNYVDADVGASKAEALAIRLRAIAPDVEILNEASAFAANLDELGDESDLIIDATASAPIAGWLDLAAKCASPDLYIAQIATDSTSATLGLVTLTSTSCVPSEVDRQVRDRVFADPTLEGFRILWDPADDLLTPARGCSTPTFRGSAADVMGVAASAVALLGGLLRAGRSGAQLFALPHSPAVAPALTWVPARVDDAVSSAT